MQERHFPQIEYQADAPPSGKEPEDKMLQVPAAWHSLCARTGGAVALVTFYRWLRQGRIYSFRLGWRIFVPRDALDDFIRKCLEGD